LPLKAEIETDEWENSSTYYLAIDGEKVLGTARWRLIDNQTAKIERVAVLKEARSQGIGIELMRYILTEIHANSNIQTIKLGSQNSAIPFYETLGFQVIGEEYLDAGIPHHFMLKNNSDV